MMEATICALHSRSHVIRIAECAQRTHQWKIMKMSVYLKKDLLISTYADEIVGISLTL